MVEQQRVESTASRRENLEPRASSGSSWPIAAIAQKGRPRGVKCRITSKLKGWPTAATPLGEMSGTYKATGKSFKTPFVHVWRFSADRLQSFSAHMDTLVYQRALQ
jgi:hypothetical protein